MLKNELAYFLYNLWECGDYENGIPTKQDLIDELFYSCHTVKERRQLLKEIKQLTKTFHTDLEN